MAKPSTQALRKLSLKRRVQHHGNVHYADVTSAGTIIDAEDAYTRQARPIALERFNPAHRPENGLPTRGLMAEPVQPAVWEVIRSYPSFEVALPAVKAIIDKQRTQPKNEEYSHDWWYDHEAKGQTLRLRDRRTNDIILCDVL